MMDIEKVFHHANWGVLNCGLDQNEPGQKWNRWIGWCISMISFSI